MIEAESTIEFAKQDERIASANNYLEKEEAKLASGPASFIGAMREKASLVYGNFFQKSQSPLPTQSGEVMFLQFFSNTIKEAVARRQQVEAQNG